MDKLGTISFASYLSSLGFSSSGTAAFERFEQIFYMISVVLVHLRSADIINL